MDIVERLDGLIATFDAPHESGIFAACRKEIASLRSERDKLREALEEALAHWHHSRIDEIEAVRAAEAKMRAALGET